MDNHGDIKHFEIVAEAEGEESKTVQATQDKTSEIIPGLKSFKNYTVQITTVNKPSVIGDHGGQGGDPSEAVSKVTWPARKLLANVLREVMRNMLDHLPFRTFRWGTAGKRDMRDASAEFNSHLGPT